MGQYVDYQFFMLYEIIKNDNQKKDFHQNELHIFARATNFF